MRVILRLPEIENIEPELTISCNQVQLPTEELEHQLSHKTFDWQFVLHIRCAGMKSRTEFEPRWPVSLKHAAGQFYHHHVACIQLPGLQRSCPCTQPWSPSMSQLSWSSHYSSCMLWFELCPFLTHPLSDGPIRSSLCLSRAYCCSLQGAQ